MTEAKKLALAQRLFFLYFTKHSISFSLKIVIDAKLHQPSYSKNEGIPFEDY